MKSFLFVGLVILVLSEANARLQKYSNFQGLEISEKDQDHLDLFRNLVDSNLVHDVGRKTFWNSPLQKYRFYMKVLKELKNPGFGTITRSRPTSDEPIRVLPLSTIQRKIARTSSKLLRIASDFEDISYDVGAVQVFAGSLGVLGGLLSVGGLILAPFTGGGSLLLLAGFGSYLVSSAITTFSTTVQDSWRQSYVDLAISEGSESLNYLDLITGVVVEAEESLEGMDGFIRDMEEIQGATERADELVKNDWDFKTAKLISAYHSNETYDGPRLEAMVDLMDMASCLRSKLKEISQSEASVELVRSFFKDQDTSSRLEALGRIVNDPESLFDSFVEDIEIVETLPLKSLKKVSFAKPILRQAKMSLASRLLNIGGSFAAVGTGIWSIVKGETNLKGGGVFSDRIRRFVSDLDQQSQQALQLYHVISERGRDSDSGHFRRHKVVSGLEVHTCWITDAQSDSPVSLEIESDGFNCLTKPLSTDGHNDLEVNQWDTYRSRPILDSCSDFLINEERGDFRVRFRNFGGGAHCADIVNIEVDHLYRPYYTCHMENGTWSDYGHSSWIPCQRAADISRIDVYVCPSNYAGTDSYVKLKLKSGNKTCETHFLDNNGNDLGRGQKSTYRADIIGNCNDLEIVDDSLEVAFIHDGYDALCIGNLVIHGFSSQRFGRAQEFKCDIPFQNTFEYNTTDFYPCAPFELKPNSMMGITPHVCDAAWSGSLTGFYVGVSFEICNSKECCSTNFLDMYWKYELQTGSADFYDFPGALGSCYGFPLSKNDNVTFSAVNTNSDAICIEKIELHAKQGLGLYSYLACDPEQPVWAAGETKGPFSCQTKNETTVHQIETRACDPIANPGRNASAIVMKLCQDDADLQSPEQCCLMDALDPSDDLDLVDFDLYKSMDFANCTDFKIYDDMVSLSIQNTGGDTVCFKQVRVKTSNGKRLFCSVPNEDLYWTENGWLDLRCLRNGE